MQSHRWRENHDLNIYKLTGRFERKGQVVGECQVINVFGTAISQYRVERSSKRIGAARRIVFQNRAGYALSPDGM